MTVEAGKLTPADAFSAERLESYRHGTTMFVQPITDPQSKKRRKFWAILGLVIKNCETPWRTVKDAANAIKRTFGLMDDGGTTGNVRIMYPRSLNDLSEPEFEEFYEDAMLYLQRVTGVDPETLSKEAPDAGDDPEPPASDLPPETSEGSGGGSLNPSSPAAAATPRSGRMHRQVSAIRHRRGNRGAMEAGKPCPDRESGMGATIARRYPPC
ncbi:hypothetical protein [Sinorhizobium medicae]